MSITIIESLNARTAYLPNTPIRYASDMPAGILTKESSADWLERTKNKFWSTSYEGDTSKLEPVFQEMLRMRDFILTFGGRQVCMPFIEDDIDNILVRGQLWYGDRNRLIIGRPNGCHQNSAHLWEEDRRNGNENRYLATGYALSNDGIWRQHSWVVDIKDVEPIIIETTTNRLAYFGFVMTDEEAAVFLENQY